MGSLANQLELFQYIPVAKSAAETESFRIAFNNAEKEMAKIELAKKRYYLHRVLKDKYLIDPDNWTIEIPYKTFTDIPVGERYHVNELMKIGYNVQMTLV
ncbi:MAG: hypothetical protein EOO20_28960 [Chryseobacterium sp.]|nr:MAG: hypothetical protein EOO20_28960 [Chryseobacterium sp.]